MRLSTLCFLALLCAPVCGLSAQEPTIRVQIIAALDQIAVEPSSAWWLLGKQPLKLGGGKQAVVECKGASIRLSYDGHNYEDTVLTLTLASDTSLFLIRSVPYGAGWWWEGREDRCYQGELRVRPSAGGKLNVVVALPLERYLRGVVPYEIGSAPFEALRAQAIAARSEAMAALRNHLYAGDGFDICGDVDCQVFGGVTRTTALVDRAILSTRGVVLQSKGQPINAFFASNCGGHSESIENVWPRRGGPRLYYGARPDADTLHVDSLQDETHLRRWLADGPPTYCNPTNRPGIPEWSGRYWRWKVGTSSDSLGLTSRGLRAGRIVRIDSIQRGLSGRIISARFVGDDGSFTVSSELEFRQVWSPPLRSSCVVIDPIGPPAHPDRFLITGGGWGHGVGMCQSGAVGRALAGQKAEKILRHYFPTAEIKAAY